MRLFYAITFNDDVKNKLCAAMDSIKPHCKSGNFTARENLHLTLVFIGETPFNKIALVKEAALSAAADPFSITLGGIGCFKRRGGDILWTGVKRTPSLLKIYDSLCAGLKCRGFKIEERRYSPHITLARQAKLNSGHEILKNNTGGNQTEEFSSIFTIPSINARVEKISLMKSERISGKLRYTEFFSQQLKKKG